MKKLNTILSTMASTKIAMLVLVMVLSATIPSVIAQPGHPGSIIGLVTIDGIPVGGIDVYVENVDYGTGEMTTTGYDTDWTMCGYYVVYFPRVDGLTARATVVYEDVEYSNTMVTDLTNFNQWLNISIDTGSPPPEYTICAYVVDADTSIAISGATVTCDGKSEYTDTNGIAYFTVFPNMYTIMATKTGYQSDSTTVTVDNDVFTTLYLVKIDADPPDDPPADPPDDPPADPPADPPDDDENEEDGEEEPGDKSETIFYTLTVAVFDNVTEMPINNASVIIYDPELNELGRNCTNESGMITFQLEEGDYVIVAEKDDYIIKRGAVNLLTSMEHTMMLMNEEGLDGSGDFVAQQNVQGQNPSIMYAGACCIVAIIVVAVLLIRWKGWI